MKRFLNRFRQPRLSKATRLETQMMLDKLKELRHSKISTDNYLGVKRG